MSRLVDVGAADELADGTMKAVKVEDRDLLVARVGDAYYAADERCPHMGGHLSRGSLQGTIVVCPRHGSRFDLTDGRVAQWTSATGLALSVAKLFKAPRPLQTYPVRSRDGRLLVELE
jgi:3-phenylpropionate/trans-cinnamate dioxygenase ferredoxin subunit